MRASYCQFILNCFASRIRTINYGRKTFDGTRTRAEWFLRSYPIQVPFIGLALASRPPQRLLTLLCLLTGILIKTKGCIEVMGDA